MKRFLVSIALIAVTLAMCFGVFSGASDISDDPSDIYTVQKAPFEDSEISMWFEHSFKKVMMSDVEHSGRDTYSVYMAKNEIESAQFVLYSDVEKPNLSVEVTDFTDGFGNTLSAEIYYQMYMTLTDLDTLSPLGSTEDTTFIRNGEQPEPIAPFSHVKTFQLNAGKSQAFYIRIKSTEGSASGWYQAQLNVKNEAGDTVKTATVYTYVWDFALSEKTALQTAFYMEQNTSYGGNYKAFYDYLLENRICAMDMPGTLNKDNPYLTMDRVNTIRVSAVGGGNNMTYKDDPSAYPRYKEMYDELAALPEWEEIEKKFFFYTLDEAVSEDKEAEFAQVHPRDFPTIDDCIEVANKLKRYWPNPRMVVPYHANHPYPYTVMDAVASIEDKAVIWDGLQEMMDSGCVTVFCPMMYAFTPNYEIEAYDYAWHSDSQIRNLSGDSSGKLGAGERYFNWEGLLGEYSDRVESHIIIQDRNEESRGVNVNWAYSAGWNKGYSYCNHMIENTGLQTRLLFWQLYQEDVTGYLYYGVTYWNEYDENNGGYSDRTYTGARRFNWKMNKRCYPDTGYATYGDGTLFYGPTMARTVGKNLDVIGSVRAETMRDGIEDYQMFTMLEALRGTDAADAIVNSVSNNVVDYISMPNYDRSAYDSSLSEYDILAMRRIELGNAVEAASAAPCEHQYDDGVVTVEPKCLVMGSKVYTCLLCGDTTTEKLPTLHSEGDCFDITVGEAATCTTDGFDRYQCRICGYAKNNVVLSHHTNEATLIYKNEYSGYHSLYCSVCNELVEAVAHSYISHYTDTCTEDGIRYEECNVCGYRVDCEAVAARGHNYDAAKYVKPSCTAVGKQTETCLSCGDVKETEIPAIGHSFEDGTCTACGEHNEDYVPPIAIGDINNDGSVNLVDMFSLKTFLAFADVPSEEERFAADINGDGSINAVDSFEMSYRIAKGSWRIEF